MTPPVHDYALEVGGRPVGLSSTRVPGWSTRGVLLLGESWSVLAVAWAARLVMGTADPAVMLFAIVLLAGLVVPESRATQLVADGLFDIKGTALRVVAAYAGVSLTITLVGLGEASALLAVAVLSMPALLIGRGLTTAIWRRTIARVNPHRVVVIGSDRHAWRVLAGLRAKREDGLQVAGVIAPEPATNLGVRYLGRVEDVPSLVRSGAIEKIVVADTTGNESELTAALRQAISDGAEVWVVPRLPQLPSPSLVKENLLGLPLVKLQPSADERVSWLVKLAIDRMGAAVGLLFLAPLLALVGALVFLDSGRPVLLRQTRVGRNGRPFTLLKFRTMYVRPGSVEETEWSADDSQITRVGRVLRNLSIDELPQLFNILRGDMSLVGPRPERPHFVEVFSGQQSRYDERHRLPAGLTGLAQVNGLRGDTSIADRVSCDNYYIDAWSLEEDLKIVMRTVGSIMRKG